MSENKPHILGVIGSVSLLGIQVHALQLLTELSDQSGALVSRLVELYTASLHESSYKVV